MGSLDKATRDFLSNTTPPASIAKNKVSIENGKLYEFVMTGFEADIAGDYGNYTRYDVTINGEGGSFYLGSSVDQKTMNRYIGEWLKEGHVWPLKVKLVRYPRKATNSKRTYFDIRADLVASGDNVK